MIIKGELTFLLVQFCMFSDFSQGYIRPCTDSSLGTLNGTTVYAEMGKPVSVLFCVENGASVHHVVQIKEPQHRAGWSLANNNKVGAGKDSRVLTNITINNVQQKDLNVTFSVKICTDLHVSSGWTNDEWLIFTFLLQEQATIRLCNESNVCSSNGTSVDARVGESAHVVFCVMSEVAIHNHVFIGHPRSRSDWYPPIFITESYKQRNEVQVKFQQQEDYTKIIIDIKNINDKDFRSNFSVKVMSEQHALHPQTNKEFVFLTFQLRQKGTNPSPLHNNFDLSSQEFTNFIYIIIIVVLTVIIIALVICILVYRYRGCFKKNNSKDNHVNLEDLISPYLQYEEVGNVETVLTSGCAEQTETISSDARCEEVQYEVPVTQFSSIDTEHNYKEVKDKPPGKLCSNKDTTVRSLTKSPDSVEYENTLCII